MAGNQAANRRKAIKKRATRKDPINEAYGVKGFHPSRSQSRGGRSISVSFTLLPHQDERLSEMARDMECSRSGVVRHLLESYEQK